MPEPKLPNISKKESTSERWQKKACIKYGPYVCLSKLTSIRKPLFAKKDQSNLTAFANVQRVWLNGEEAQRKPNPRFIDGRARGAASVMMQRWHQETMRDQPQLVFILNTHHKCKLWSYLFHTEQRKIGIPNQA
ncbi:hypothetical protein FGG08_003907 [Glutinoglossum americanum]|uniref:Uncharacterized protein n=1 Tax=Glutinoglossum americanum TaxID=1670608 RepID=A0A9P8I6Q1_9PEZI|nr:hypothetical protein FGG08_003907 [Glutinoglossum americanum]